MSAGRPLVLLHGWGLSAAVWAPLLPHFSPALALHTPELPGHGQAGAAPATLEGWAEALVAGLPADAALLGWSLGAQLALAIAARFPARVRRLVLIGASPRFVQAGDWPAALPAATLSDFRADFAREPAATQRRFVALQSLGDAARREVAARLGAALTPPDAAHHAALGAGLGLLADSDLRPLVPRIAQPVRLLHGSEDRLMPLGAAEWLADTLPDGRLSVFHAAGHAPFLSRPAECAALIESFVLD